MFLRKEPKPNLTVVKTPDSKNANHKAKEENLTDTPFELKTSEGIAFVRGINISRLLHWELVREKSVQAIANSDIRAFCFSRWTELSEAIAALPETVESLMVIGSEPQVSFSFWVIGKGESAVEAKSTCQKSFQTLWTILSAKLDYIELQPIHNSPTGQPYFEALQKYLAGNHVIEACRLYESLPISYSDRPVLLPKPFGFGMEEVATIDSAVSSLENQVDLQADYLIPWMPSLDSWQIMLEMLGDRIGSAFIVHFQNLSKAPDAILEELQINMIVVEKALAVKHGYHLAESTALAGQATVLRDLYLQKQNSLSKNIIAARVFVVTPNFADSAFLSIIKTSINPTGGSVEIKQISSTEIHAPFDTPTLEVLFTPLEATSILRTPIPTNAELPGIPSMRSRTAPMLGVSGDDCLLGINSHRSPKPVHLNDELRFRHTYIIGQSGTGKSTLMKQMILHDIRQGRGVGVLDPHGELIQDILESFPKERAEDLVLIDLTDVERPVGFNILRIHETDPFQYRLARDFTIDEIYAYLDRTYDMMKTGGPMFESYYRSFMGLLMGSEQQKAPQIPNLMIFRALFGNEDLRSFLLAMEEDQLLVDAVEESLRTGGEASLDNMTPYITCKFSRFINDTALRNITCQNQMLDIDKIIKEGKVLLFYSGKGKFGEKASGLLTSQMVSRICNAAMKRGTNGNPFYLYVDEFQVLADDRFAEILAEARKFKLSLTVAHQYVDQLPSKVLTAILGNVGTIVSLRVGAIDSQRFETLFSPTFSQKDLSSLSNYFAYVKSSGTLGQIPFSIEIPNPSSVKRDTEFASRLRNISRMKYGRNRHEVEAEINKTYDSYRNVQF